MFKIIKKLLLLVLIFPLFGLGVSLLIANLEQNIQIDKHIVNSLDKNDEIVEDEEILNVVNQTVSLTDATAEIESLGIPKHIQIDSVGISLEIKEGEYNYANQTWTLANGYAYWANLSKPIMGNSSSTVIYAHNQIDEFYKTKDLKIGDVIKITTDQDKIVLFEYIGDNLVTPDRGDIIFEDSNTSQVILITCSGWFSENRKIMYATMIGYD